MKSTGIVRKVDELGRIVLPIELRRTLGISVKDPIEIFVEEQRVILQKFSPGMRCEVTGKISENNIEFAGGKLILSREGAEKFIEEIERSFLLVK